MNEYNGMELKEIVMIDNIISIVEKSRINKMAKYIIYDYLNNHIKKAITTQKISDSEVEELLKELQDNAHINIVRYSKKWKMFKQALITSKTTNKNFERELNQILKSLQELAVFKKYTFVTDHNDVLKIGHSDFIAFNTIEQALTTPKNSDSEVEVLFMLLEEDYMRQTYDRFGVNETYQLKDDKDWKQLKTKFQKMQQENEKLRKKLIWALGDCMLLNEQIPHPSASDEFVYARELKELKSIGDDSR